MDLGLNFGADEGPNSSNPCSLMVDEEVELVREKIKVALESKDWSFFAKLGERCDAAEEALGLLKLVETADESELETLCFILMSVGGRGWPQVDEKIKELVASLINFPNSRMVRKAATAALRSVVSTDACPLWSEFFVLLNALEEPQFHLVQPALAKFDLLVEAYSNRDDDAFIPPRFMHALFFKAVTHSNGWLRLWTIEKLVTMNPLVFGHDFSATLMLTLPALNNSDLFWRLIETKRIENFLLSFSRFLHNITATVETIGTFYKPLLEIFAAAWNPCSLYLLSTSLVQLSAYPAFTEQCFPLYRQILDNIAQSQYAPLKLCTSVNFMVLFVKLTCWSETTIWAFAPLLNAIPNRAFNAMMKQKLMDIFVDRSQTMMPEYNAYSLLANYLMRCRRHINNVHWYAVMTWLLAEVQQISHELFSLLCDRFVEESQMCTENFEQLDALLHLWIEGDHRESEDSFYSIVVQYLGIRLFAFEGTRREFDVFNSLHRRLMVVSTGQEAERSVHSLWALAALSFTEQDASVTRHAILLAIANVQLLLVRDELVNIESAVEGYLEENLFMPLQDFSFDEGMREADVRFAYEVLLTNRLQLALRYPTMLKTYPEAMLRKSIEELTQSLDWNHREVAASFINRLLPLVKVASERFEAVKVLILLAEEAKNTRYSLPSVKALLSACLLTEMLVDAETAPGSRYVVSELMEHNMANAEIVFTICSALHKVIRYLDVEWVPLLVELCLYGSTSKKGKLLLDYAYETAYSSKMSFLLGKSPTDMRHTLVQRTRLEALVMTYRFCSLSEIYGSAVVKRIIWVSVLLDKAHCRSFVLSLPHRQKTRLMQLLLLILDTLDEVSVDAVRQHCEESLVDRVQQPSIKLLVELILVRIFISRKAAFFRFIDKEKELAETRIGSITSWISIIMHVAKVENSQRMFERCFLLFLPWCTAQNFSARCSAIAAIKCLWSLADQKTQKKMSWLEKITEFSVETKGNAKRILESLCDDFYFRHFHAERHFTLQTILQTFPKKTGMPYDETIAVNLYRSYNGSWPIVSVCTDQRFNESQSLIYSGLAKPVNRQLDAATVDDDDTVEVDDPLQRKLDAFRGKWKRPEGTSLIVIATFVNKPANLGGLCRTSEIFGAEKLVVASLRIISDRSFKSLSLSSENWITIEQVTTSELLNYLKEKREEGYKIVAAEQATNSVPLTSFHFPPKCAVLLGDEKEGVPVEYIRYVDHTVEVTQVGQTRSLNVHVTGALFIHKYAEDNYFK